jgi:hypothetical protein
MQPKDEILSSPGNKYVVLIRLNSVDSPAVFVDCESFSPLLFMYVHSMFKVMEKAASAFPNHLVVYSSDSPHFGARQLEETPDPSPLFSPPSDTVVQGGFLKRYQLLTPGLILTLIVVFFVFVPIIVLGVNALASIQSPLRTEVPRSFSTKDRKNQ